METSNDDILNEIPAEKWVQIQEVLKKNWPHGIAMYYLIENCIQWNKKDFPGHITIYCPNDEFSVIIVTFKMGLLSCVHLYALENYNELLKKVLVKTSVIKWAEGPFIYGVHSNNWHCVKDAIKELELDEEFQFESGCYWITKENALKLNTECPADVHIGPLDIKHTDTINQVWNHSYPGSEKYISHLISKNGGVGIFLNENDNLVSWVLKTHTLGLGMLQTLFDHQRKGYAELVVKTLTKQMIDEGMDVHGYIVKVNEFSKNLFKKIHFEFIDTVFFSKILVKGGMVERC